ncbi:MAG: hypothetical protein LBV75_00290, partial [Paludibacter sp.]|nr:hypothetical protein [Paludibacter sp.]
PKTEAYFGAMAGCALIRRNVFDTTGNFNEQLSGAGDAMDWMLKLAELKIETKKIDFVAVNRRLHNNNMGVTNKQQEYSDYLKILLQRRLKK